MACLCAPVRSRRTNPSHLRFPMKSDSLDPSSNKCLRQFTDGRSCRMSRKKGHPTLCIFHAREEQQLLESEKLAAEFASLSGKLNTVTDINHPRQSLRRSSRKTHLP